MATTAPVKTYFLWRNEWLKVILQKNQYDQKKKGYPVATPLFK